MHISCKNRTEHYVFGFIVHYKLLSFTHHVIRFSKKWQAVPKSDERESKKKAKSSSKISHQGGARVDQLLRLDGCLLWDGPQGEGKVFRKRAHWFARSNKLVHPVLTGLQTARQLGDVLQICHAYIVEQFSPFSESNSLRRKFGLSILPELFATCACFSV